jgi:hypothetical protein
MKIASISFIIIVGCISNLNCYKIDDLEGYLNYEFSKKANYPYLANIHDNYYQNDDDSIEYKKALRELTKTASFNNLNDLENEQNLFSQIRTNELSDVIENKIHDELIKIDPKDEESESHSSLVGGHQYVSGNCNYLIECSL